MSINTTSNKVIAQGNGVNTVFGFNFTARLSTPAAGAAPSLANFSDGEVPNGVIDGVNTIFTLAHNPSPIGSLLLFKNGVLMKAGGIDYTLAGNVITYVAAAKPLAGDAHICSYRY